MVSWDKHNEKSECSTALTVDANLSREPWRCQHCRQLMYLTDESGYPRQGAPLPKYGGFEYPEVCNLCFGMVSAINNRTYWIALHDAWKARQKGNDKLKFGNDYFSGSPS